MKKTLILFSAGMLMAFCAWSQAPERNMVTDGLISGMEANIGDLNPQQEDQIINAFNKYVKESRQASPATQQQALISYQAEVKRVLTPEKYAVLAQNPKMKSNPAFQPTTAPKN